MHIKNEIATNLNYLLCLIKFILLQIIDDSGRSMIFVYEFQIALNRVHFFQSCTTFSAI